MDNWGNNMDERFKTHSEVGHVYSMYSKIIFFVYTWFASAREKKHQKTKQEVAWFQQEGTWVNLQRN